MYHNYKNKSGGYFKGRSKSGKFYTSKYPPFPKNAFRGSGETKPGVVIFILLFIFLLIMLFLISVSK